MPRRGATRETDDAAPRRQTSFAVEPDREGKATGEGPDSDDAGTRRRGRTGRLTTSTQDEDEDEPTTTLDTHSTLADDPADDSEDVDVFENSPPASDDDDDADDDVPSTVARSWKAKHRLRLSAAELVGPDWTPRATMRQARPKHSIDSTKHQRANSAAIPTLSSPMAASPSAGSAGHIEYTALPYAARLDYEAAYARRWKAPMALLVEILIAKYTLLPPVPTARPTHELKHSLSVVEYHSGETNDHDHHDHQQHHQIVLSEDFDAEISASPMGSPTNHSSALHPGSTLRHHRSASASLSIHSQSASPSSAAMRERDRDEAERHSLAKGKLKIQAALLRRKQLEWQRLVQSGQATWEELERQEQEQEEKRKGRMAERHRTIVSRIIDPRDHSAQKKADAVAQQQAEQQERMEQVDWYWNSIPIAAVAIMRVLEHNHAFDACLPPKPHAAAGPGASLAPTSLADPSKHKRHGSAERPQQQLCRTWLLGDLLYSLRCLLVSVVANEPEVVPLQEAVLNHTRASAHSSPASATSGIGVGSGKLPVPSPASQSTYTPSSSPRSVLGSRPTTQRTPIQVQARLIWLLNNLVVLMHLTKRLAERRREEGEERRRDGRKSPRSAGGHGEATNGAAHHSTFSGTFPAGGGSPNRHPYQPIFHVLPSEWATSSALDFPVEDAGVDAPMKGSMTPHHGSAPAHSASSSSSSSAAHRFSDPSVTAALPLHRLQSNIAAYVFEQGYDRASDNPYHWFYCWLIRLARTTAECLVQHWFSATLLHQLHPSQLLHPSELMSLGSDTLDGVIEALGSIYESATTAGLLNLLKSQLIQSMLEQFERAILQTVLTDPHIRPSASSSASRHTQQRLLAQSVPLGMKLSMVYSCLEDWSQRVTAFAHPFVQATRTTLAPLKEACLFCLLDDKSDLDTLESFAVLAPSMPRALLLALCQAYNNLPNNDDLVSTRVLKQLRKIVDQQAREEDLKAQERDQEFHGHGTGSAENTAYGSPKVPVASSKSVSAVSAADVVIPFPVLPPFLLSYDLAPQLGRFILSAVDLPDQLTKAHPAFHFLQKKDEKLVL